MQNPKVTVIGEALIDLVPGEAPLAYRATPGGSPYNVAIGLARLGQDTTLMARLADNAFGRILRDRAVAEGIDLDAAPHTSEPTTLAVVCLDAAGTPATTSTSTARPTGSGPLRRPGACPTAPPSCTSGRSRRGPPPVPPA